MCCSETFTIVCECDAKQKISMTTLEKQFQYFIKLDKVSMRSGGGALQGLQPPHPLW